MVHWQQVVEITTVRQRNTTALKVNSNFIIYYYERYFKPVNTTKAAPALSSSCVSLYLLNHSFLTPQQGNGSFNILALGLFI